jgi:selenocysteine lyase/cysteine desulfurase
VADDAEIEGTVYGGTGVKSAHPYHLEEYPYRLEAGTQNLAGIAGLRAGLKWIQDEGRERMYHHEMELFGLLQAGLDDIKGVNLVGPRGLERRVATLSVTVDNYDPSDVGTLLDVDHDILTRTGLQCAPLIHEHHGTAPRGTVRFSMGPFTVREHVDAAVKAMEEIVAARSV